MKKILILTIFCGLCFFSEGSAIAYEAGPNDVNLKLDMPNIVKISDDVSIGAEVMRRWYREDEGDFDYYLDKEGGWTGNIKVTVKWSLLDFSKQGKWRKVVEK